MTPTRFAAAALAAGTLAVAAPLAAQTAAFDNSTPYHTQTLDNAATYGSSMAGMQVTAYFHNGTSSTDTWRDLGFDGDGVQWFGASTGLFRLAFAADVNTGDPGSFGWSLTNAGGVGLTRLVLSGAAGRTVFDTFMDDERTPNSALGYPLQLAGDPFGAATPYAADAIVTYANPVGVGGAAPRYDIYEHLDLAFGTALGANETVYFTQDTDSSVPGSAIEGPSAPGTTTTPEPASLGLVALGLGGLAGVARRRRAR